MQHYLHFPHPHCPIPLPVRQYRIVPTWNIGFVAGSLLQNIRFHIVFAAYLILPGVAFFQLCTDTV
jgi:hypothetical protein